MALGLGTVWIFDEYCLVGCCAVWWFPTRLRPGNSCIHTHRRENLTNCLLLTVLRYVVTPNQLTRGRGVCPPWAFSRPVICHSGAFCMPRSTVLSKTHAHKIHGDLPRSQDWLLFPCFHANCWWVCGKQLVYLRSEFCYLCVGATGNEATLLRPFLPLPLPCHRLGMNTMSRSFLLYRVPAVEFCLSWW